MAMINKIDFYCGAFLSYLISNKAVEPTLFDPTENSRIIQFSLKKTDYNAYVKYSTTSKTPIKKGKEYTKWNIHFQKEERNYLLYDFSEADRENIVVFVCTNKELKNSCFAVLTFEQAKECLGSDEINSQSRITVQHQKSSPDLLCYGTALSDKDAIPIKRDPNVFFELKEKTKV